MPWEAPQQQHTPEFDALYRDFAPRVRALALRRLSGRDLADDVVQETFLRAFRAMSSFDRSRPPWPWLKTIAGNVCIDLLRDGRCWREVPDETVADEVDQRVDDVDPADIFVNAERRRSIVEAMAAMNVRQRRVVMLRDLEGWRAEDVAGLENTSVNAVKSTLKRGRETFRQAYLVSAGSRGLLGVALAPIGGLARRARAALRRAHRLAGAPGAVGLPIQLLTASAGVLLVTGAVAAVVSSTILDSRPALSVESKPAPAPLTTPAEAPATTAQEASPIAPVSTGAKKSDDDDEGTELVGVEAGAAGASVSLEAGIDAGEGDTLEALLLARVPVAPYASFVSAYVGLYCDHSGTRQAACDAVTATPPTPAAPGVPAP